MLRSNALTQHLTTHLINEGILQAALVHQAIQHSQDANSSIIHYLVQNKMIASARLTQCCQKIFGLEVFDLAHYDPMWLKQSPLNFTFIRQHKIVPLQKKHNILTIGLTDPTDTELLDELTFQTGLRIQPVLIDVEQFYKFIQTHGNDAQENKNLQLTLINKISLDAPSPFVQENIVSYDEPLIQFVDHIIANAIQQRASDIHIEPYEKNCRIRYRQQGMLSLINEIPLPLADRMATRLKVMAKLDIAERRLPQDGRFHMHEIDIRINTCPTLFGEKIVLRLLNPQHLSLNIDDLAFSPTQKTLFINKINQSQGMMLVTGPTGSGKTVTLYSALAYLNHQEKNISTAEDPIEIRLHGINQVNINTKIGLDFPTVLRAFLRQDPDVIMVGEIRDPLTAQIALQAAQTGHLILSTLHTNSAIETIFRLQAMDIASYLLDSLSLIIAQRLLRKLCEYCKQLDLDTHYHLAVGCSHCLHGYSERFAIYEFLSITEPLRKLLQAGAPSTTVLQQAKIDGFVALDEAGMKKVQQGTTSLAELQRVL